MKRTLSQLAVILLLVLMFPQNANSQDIKGGTVKYEQMNFIDFDYTPTGNTQRDNWFANLPKGKKVGKVLYFNDRYSLYEKDDNTSVAPLEGRQGVMMERLSMGSAPKPVLQTSWMDSKKGLRADVFELMTRLFRVEEKLESTSWKPGKEQRKILGYTCQDASYKDGEKIITAWFTPEIPVSYGPGLYYGLPGLILAIEVDGKNEMLALEVKLEEVDKSMLTKQSDGKKTSQKEFDILLESKVKEWEEEQAKRETQRSDLKR
jgi:GLPGLI family protein